MKLIRSVFRQFSHEIRSDPASRRQGYVKDSSDFMSAGEVD